MSAWVQFRQEYLDTLYRYAKFQYECGNYSGAAEYLYFFRVLVSSFFIMGLVYDVLAHYDDNRFDKYNFMKLDSV